MQRRGWILDKLPNGFCVTFATDSWHLWHAIPMNAQFKVRFRTDFSHVILYILIFKSQCLDKACEHVKWRWTLWGREAHICVGNLTIIGSDKVLVPVRCRAIIWNNAVILLIRTLGTNFNETWSEISTFSFKKMRLKMSANGDNFVSNITPHLTIYPQRASDTLCEQCYFLQK